MPQQGPKNSFFGPTPFNHCALIYDGAFPCGIEGSADAGRRFQYLHLGFPQGKLDP